MSTPRGWARGPYTLRMRGFAPARLTRLARCVTVSALLGLGGCNASYPTAPTALAAVDHLEIHVPFPTSGRYAVGSTSHVIVYAVDTDGAYVDVTPSVATTSTDSSVIRAGMSPGQFRAVGPGKASLVVAYQGFTASIDQEVVPSTTSYPQLRVELGPLAREIGSSAQGRATFFEFSNQFRDVSNQVTWSSSKPGVASVSAGRVTSIGVGTTEIRATFAGVSGWLYVSVPPGEAR